MSNAAKSYFAMPKGLNTEAPLLNFPDGYTTEEQNYDLTIKGERRRRLGLSLETGGNAISVSTSGHIAGYPVRVFDWENVSNVPSLNFVVMQVGYTLYIFDDANPTSPTLKAITLDFRPYSVSDATDAQIAESPLQGFFGRGHLFLVGKYTNPFYIQYNTDTEVFVVSQIDVTERDFEGVDDGYDNTAQPTSAIDTHTYNLRNRGWTTAFIASYQADQSKQPSKAMIPWLGLRRALTASNGYDDDGIRSFVPAKLVQELFQDASAPQGHLIKSPFSTSSNPDSNTSLAISTWTISGTTAGPQTLTVTTSGNHGLAPAAVITISNLVGWYNTTPGIPVTPLFEVNGSYTVVTTPTATTFTVVVTFPGSYPFVTWYNQFVSKGSVLGAAIANPSGTVTDFRPKAGAFFAGRIWYAGIDTPKLGGRIYFSQVIEADLQYGKCYQVADPTDERVSDLTPADGGVIPIPEAANVLKLLPFNSSLIVFASNGVWEIGPGDLGYFAATSYSIRKLTNNGTTSAGSVVFMDTLPVYFGVTDIYRVEPNPRTGVLEVFNISRDTINTLYNNIPLTCRRFVEGTYDDLNKRVVWLYASSTSINEYAYDSALIYDERMNAFITYRFAYEATNYLTGIFTLKEAGEVSKVKYLGLLGTNLYIGEANNYTDYKDFGLSEPDCYMITAYDSIRSPSDFKTAPVVWVFSRKTETGYDGSLNAIRPSSTLMQARWEWADHVNASRWGVEQQVYRHQRTYVPVDASDTYDDGIPVVVTKNKLRGKGRVLQLKFTAGTGVDSYIMGWKTNYTRIQQ
jgi:hypothetical protein